MADPTFAWTLWDLVSAVEVLVVLAAPAAVVAVGGYYVWKWRRGGDDRPQGDADARPA